MIERLGFTLHLDTGSIDYLSSNPIVYQGSQSSYYFDFDFKKGNNRIKLDDYTFITITFRRSDGNVSSPLLLERETEEGENYSIFSKLLNSGWYFDKAGNLAFSLKVCKRVQSGVDTNDEPVYTTQILTTANGYVNVVASASFDSSAPIPPSAYEDVLQNIQENADDINNLDERLTALDDEETGEVSLLKGRMDTAESDIDSLELRMGSAEDDIDYLQEKAIKSIASGTPTNNYVEIIPTYCDGNVGNPVQIQLAGTMATEEEATSITNNAVNDYNTNTVQPKFTQLDNELSTAVHYDELESTEQVAIEVANAVNVTDTINGKALSDIFESNGTTVKNATNSTNATNAEFANKDIDGNIISSTYLKISDVKHLYKHHIVGKVSANEFRFEVYSPISTPVTSVQSLITVLGTDYANWNCIPVKGDTTTATGEIHGNFTLPYNMKIENGYLNIYYLKLSQVSGASTQLTWETASTPFYIESFDSDTVYRVL